MRFFREKKAQFEKGGTFPKLGFAISHKKKTSLEASHKASCLISKQKKPCGIEMVKLVCGLDQRKKMK
jgi:hypothetical protein